MRFIYFVCQLPIYNIWSTLQPGRIYSGYICMVDALFKTFIVSGHLCSGCYYTSIHFAETKFLGKIKYKSMHNDTISWNIKVISLMYKLIYFLFKEKILCINLFVCICFMIRKDHCALRAGEYYSTVTSIVYIDFFLGVVRLPYQHVIVYT